MIYGIGLPRTGSQTLAAALRGLGYVGRNSCEIMGTFTLDLELADDDPIDFEVNNSFYRYESIFSALRISDPNNLYILTDRNKDKHAASIRKVVGFYPEDMPDIYNYKLKVRNTIPVSQLLIVDWSRHGWKELCGFLNKPIPFDDFPCENC